MLGYLAALRRLFVVDDVPAWSPALRSRAVLRSAPTRHFVDPSLAVAALGTGPERLLRDVRTFGYLFESLVARDLRVYAQATDAALAHYRDSTELEVDAIVERRDGVWAAFEVKLGQADVERAAANLLRLAARVDPDLRTSRAPCWIPTNPSSSGSARTATTRGSPSCPSATAPPTTSTSAGKPGASTPRPASAVRRATAWIESPRAPHGVARIYFESMSATTSVTGWPGGAHTSQPYGHAADDIEESSSGAGRRDVPMPDSVTNLGFGAG